jgi:hypothetical protein
MTLAQLLSSLFNLNAQNGPLTSLAAARGFWFVFAVVAAMICAAIAIRSTSHGRSYARLRQSRR